MRPQQVSQVPVHHLHRWPSCCDGGSHTELTAVHLQAGGRTIRRLLALLVAGACRDEQLRVGDGHIRNGQLENVRDVVCEVLNLLGAGLAPMRPNDVRPLLQACSVLCPV